MAAEISIEVLLFARMREACAQRARVSLRVPSGATPETCFERLCEDFGAAAAHRTGLVVAVNEEYAGWDAELGDGDEVSFIPPVSGG